MRLSCQLRKYLSQFVACNRLSLSPRPVRCFTRPPPDRRPIYEQLVVAVRHPLSIHLSSLSLLFSFPLPFPVLVARGIIIRRCRQNTFRPTGLATTLLRSAQLRDSRALTFACITWGRTWERIDRSTR